ncbi:DUF4055 domain-containing protein [Oligella sp. HMSC09E12]|uniref:DUF4055 domain-containing protein n=1 Tax=Oligella sp. HMSC09E12 TaxID=1581147 RepID=UPI0008A0FDA9|nr:DUF4055 domain-containing protein [Oligella sp. HMSC09E12]OFV47349.1 hypothetical protein HMPREF3179_08635 [Oligella sp. HMSC09E12]
MSVTTQHPQYIEHLPEWEMIDDAISGEESIKKENKYLPKPSGMEQAERIDPSNRYLFDGYKARAQYEHWVRDSLRSMMGMASRLNPEIELPEALSYMVENATGDGFGLKQLFLRMVSQVISHGRIPLVVNVDNQGLPYFSTYAATSAINWKKQLINGRYDLALAVFTEFRDKNPEDEYSHDKVRVYRVFKMIDGIAHSGVFDENNAVVEEVRPLGVGDSSGRLLRGLSYLPIVYCGSTDNAPDVDEVPLLSMARAALKSYQLSADYFTSLHYTSHPQPWVSGLGTDVELSVTGPSAAWDLGENGACGYLEFHGAGIEAVRQAMKDQKSAALEAGAKVMNVSGVESGEARRARQADQHATLHVIVITVAEALKKALQYAAEWAGFKGDIVFSVNPDFEIPEVNPHTLAQIQQAVVTGGVSWETYWTYLSAGKIPEHDYNQEALRIENPGNIVYE